MTYSFTGLSSFDLELLTRDLLQRVLNVRLQAFRTGRDGGIDLRYSTPTETNSLVVQCKHYAGSTYATLKKHLRDVELPKVRALSPQRYILVTSQALSPKQKDELHTIFAPYCASPQDIFGRDDINGVLAANPDIERSHFKLWITSTTVLERVLHGALHTETETERQRIYERAKLYVQTPAFGTAASVLDETHVCVIAGIPGIGKTTLAEMLLLDHLGRDYEVHVVSNDIRDATSVWKPDTKQLFYYDDFLGQVSIGERLQKNEDQRLVRFIDLVKRSPATRLILTTREYILAQARQVHEKLDVARLDDLKCVVSLESYRRPHRAKILFNHLHFSRLPIEYKGAMLDSQTYRSIVDHKNFSPRIVEWMTDMGTHRRVAAEAYCASFLANLDRPLDLWRHAFDNQLSDAAQALLLVLATLPSSVEVDRLEEAFIAFYDPWTSKRGLERRANDFARALRESEETFIKITAGLRYHSDSPVLIVSLHNPSIRDFIHTYLAQQLPTLQALLKTATFFAQVVSIASGLHAAGDAGNSLKGAFRRYLDDGWIAFERTFASQEVTVTRVEGWLGPRFDIPKPRAERRLTMGLRACGDPASSEVGRGAITSIARALSKRWRAGEGETEDVVEVLSMVRNGCIKEDFEELRDSAKNLMFSDLHNSLTFGALAEFLNEHPESFDERETTLLVTHIKDFADTLDVYEYQNPETLDEVRSSLLAAGEAFGVDLDGKLDEIRERVRELEAEGEAPPSSGRHWSQPVEQEMTDEELDDMFALLSE